MDAAFLPRQLSPLATLHDPLFHHGLGQVGGKENITAISDVGVEAVILSCYLNGIVFLICGLAFEILRRWLPTIYNGSSYHKPSSRQPPPLPSSLRPSSIWTLWTTVHAVPWHNVLECAGLDAYMFLRYIRLCGRVTSVSAFWGMIILGTVYGTAGGGETGWYRMSMKNIPPIDDSPPDADDDDAAAPINHQYDAENGLRLWVTVTFMYMLTFYVIYLLSEEYKHFVELRMVYLAKGDPDITPQHHYSLRIEDIPPKLKSEKSLFRYFDKLFPGKVHSVSVVLNIPEMDKVMGRRERVRRRLEKAVAIEQATGEAAEHFVGRARCLCCGIESSPIIPFKCCGQDEKVNSSKYYADDLEAMNESIKSLIDEKLRIAHQGTGEEDGDGLLGKMIGGVQGAIKGIGRTVTNSRAEVKSGDGENGLGTNYGSFDESDLPPTPLSTDSNTSPSSQSLLKHRKKPPQQIDTPDAYAGAGISLLDNDYLTEAMPLSAHGMSSRASSIADLIQPGGRDKHKSCLRRFMNKLGLDFLSAGVVYVHNKFNSVVVDSVFVRTMSSTGFITFTDLQTVACASAVTLTHKADTLDLKVAPEPRDIYWPNAHVSQQVSAAKQNMASTLILFGALIWSAPVATVQALATTEQLAKLPWLSWLDNVSDDDEENKQRDFYVQLINGYLPVLALLGLIQLLPFIFQYVAVHYESRKTQSDVQRSILRRFFYYQMANIFITVTAGSLLENLGEIIGDPQSILSLMADKVPTVVGYFISLIVTKILAGLPVVLLRLGALFRMAFLRCSFSEKMLTQRELNEVYRPQELLYGWEYPTQLLVIVICFTYSCISPIILPVGAIYFTCALLVYKFQVLYVYTPEYESGGELFPSVLHRTLVGLTCGQVTLLAYLYLILGFGKFWQPYVLLPLPFYTLWMVTKFSEQYDKPSERLSLERAVAIDHENTILGYQEELIGSFDKFSYRQPFLDPANAVLAPEPYRTDISSAV
ncbi:hypothetical protein TrST_g9881 [Triparma strigata]|uniref:Uncharacterized protein n=1 Tax=Triparma strigata TaxID=1606541 RepID=A0A9W7AQM7_9STRA|nr:hypothetical protein TrST_g9881 [Triparma strigata]